MSQYDNTNRGVLFKNDRKDKDTHPDYKGTANVDGDEFWISAWIKQGSKGPFMSLSFQPKEGGVAKPQGASGKQMPIDDEIPF